MSENLGDAVLRLSVDDSGLDTQLDAAGKKAESKVSRAGKNVAKVGAGLTLGLTAPILAFGKIAADELGEIQKQNAVTAATIKSMGLEAKFSVAGIQEMAGRLQKLSGVDDQVIQGMTNIGLTFSNLAKRGPKTMEDIQRIALGMSTVIGMDASAAMQQLGKAMQDPVKGATALTRTGSLAKSELEQLKDMAEAGASEFEQQNFIMAALEKQYGKAAAAAGGQFPAKLAVLKDQFAGIGATLLSTLMPTFQKFADFLGRLMDRFNTLSPGMQSFIAKALLIGAVLGPVLVMVGAVATAIGAIGLPILAAVAAIGVLGGILLKSGVNLDKVKAKVIALGQGIRTFVQVLTGQSTQARSTMTGMQQAFAIAADKVKAAFEKIVAFVRPVFNELRQTISVWVGWAKAFWNRFGGDIMQVTQTIFGRIAAVVGPLLNAARSIIVAILRLLRGDFSGAWSSIKSAAVSFFQALVAYVKGIGATFLDAAKFIGKAIIDGIMAALRAGADQIVSFVTSLGDRALGAIKKKLHIASPSKRFYNEVGLPISQGIALGISAGTSGIIERLTTAVDRATGAVQKRLKRRLAVLQRQASAAQRRLDNILNRASMGQSVANLWDSQRDDTAANVKRENTERIGIANREKAQLQAYLKNTRGLSMATRQGIIDRIAQINDDIRGWNEEMTAAAEAEAKAVKDRADAAENLRREALGLPSLEEEAHIAALNAIRAQYGLPLLDQYGNAPETPEPVIDTTMPDLATTDTSSGGAAGGTPVVIYQTFSGEPDMYAASHKASFAYRTVGLGVA